MPGSSPQLSCAWNLKAWIIFSCRPIPSATNNRILAVPAGPKSQLELTSQAPPQLYQTVRHYRLMTVYHIELLAASSWQIRPRKHRSTREA
ncbi:hypothetical protein TWF217_008663 [Orbilia oligospora]|nr:hypothetical protein TWF217_008663 [Orbilia oligospora]